MSMLRPVLVAGGPGDLVSVSGGNLTWVVIVAIVALAALGVAGVLVREVLAASQGTQRMQDISRAVQEGAAAYLRRQFRTLGIFVVIIFFVLLVLPVPVLPFPAPVPVPVVPPVPVPGSAPEPLPLPDTSGEVGTGNRFDPGWAAVSTQPW